MEYLNGLMEKNIKVIGKMENKMVKANIIIQKKKFGLKVFGKKVKKKKIQKLIYFLNQKIESIFAK